jgi:hypothetical protein
VFFKETIITIGFWDLSKSCFFVLFFLIFLLHPKFLCVSMFSIEVSKELVKNLDGIPDRDAGVGPGKGRGQGQWQGQGQGQGLKIRPGDSLD